MTHVRQLLPTFVVAVLVFLVLGLGGATTRHYVADAFEASQRISRLRDLNQQLLKLQLDEETGIRGYAATGDARFLQPYNEAQGVWETVAAQLEAALRDPALADAGNALAQARLDRAQWRQRVAAPIRTSPTRNALAIQLYGKELVDRFRVDLAVIDTALGRDEAAIAAAGRSAIYRINVFVMLAIALLLLASLLVAAQQVRGANRLHAQEQLVDDERRQIVRLEGAYEVEKRIADTLQDAFTQRPLPNLTALRFSATYVPAEEYGKVGGDWYDAIELPADRVLFAIGDVTGHGIQAAVTMNRARQSLICSALLDVDPGRMLTHLNAELIGAAAPLVTAIAGYADARASEFVYAIAGHPPPVLIEPGKAPRLLPFGSLPLGAVDESAYRSHRINSVPGAILVLYTDGAIEYTRDVLQGEDTLLRAVAGLEEYRGDDSAAFIHRAIFGGRAVGDDVAILTVGFAAAPGERADPPVSRVA
jgi:CHASE3 domain sensor protein